MKKFAIVLLLVAIALVSVPSRSFAANSEPGGLKGFVAGCCFGLRVGTDYNENGTGKRDYFSWWLVGCCFGPRTQMEFRDGKDIHWRDIGDIIPYIGVIFHVWDGIDTAGGKTRADIQKTYGASYY